MKPIPPILRQELERDPWYRRCCMTGKTATQGKIEWHHNLQHAHGQINEKFAILPLLERIHARVREREIRQRLDWIMCNRATHDQIKEYGLEYRAITLNAEYGPYNPYGRYEL